MPEELELNSTKAEVPKNVRPMPHSVALIGLEEQGVKKVYLEFSAYLRILRHAKSGGESGLEGFLLGGESLSGDIIIETVCECVKASDSDGLKRAREERDVLYPSLNVIGRYICRPEGKEVSEADALYQHSYFSDESNTLFLYDTSGGAGAFYVWDGDKLRRLAGYYLFARAGEVDLSLCEDICRSAQKEQDSRLGHYRELSHRVYALSIATFISVAMLLIAFAYLFARDMELEKRLTAPVPIQGQLATAEPTLAPPSAQPEETPVPSQQAETPSPSAAPAVYIVQRGDTIEKISLKYFGTASRAQDIADANKININSVLKVGQKLKMPRD